MKRLLFFLLLLPLFGNAQTVINQGAAGTNVKWLNNIGFNGYMKLPVTGGAPGIIPGSYRMGLNGLMAYDSTNKIAYINNGTSWVAVGDGLSALPSYNLGKVLTVTASGIQWMYPIGTPVNILVSGNSTIAAYLGQNSVASYLFSGAQNTVGYTAYNMAYPGATISTGGNQQYANWDTVANKSFYKGASIEIGLNDVDPTEAASVAIARLQAYVAHIRNTTPVDFKIVIATMTPCKQRFIDVYGATDGATAYTKWLAMNTAISGGGGTPITGVDARVTGHTAALNDGSGNLASQYEVSGTTDHIHENNEARQIVAFYHRRGLYDAALYYDATLPTATFTVTDSLHITATFSERVTATSAGYSFTKNSSALTVSSATTATGTTTIVFTTSTVIHVGDTIRVSYSQSTGNTLDDAYNELGTLTSVAVTNSLTNAIILSNASGISSGITGALGNAPEIEILSLKAVSKVTTAGTVNSVKFNIIATPTGITNFYFKVLRLNGGLYDQVGSTITISAGSFGALTTGVNSWTNPSPFAVQVGDVVVAGYTGTSTNVFMGGLPGSSGDSYYLLPPPGGTTGIDWSGGTPLATWMAVQLAQ